MYHIGDKSTIEAADIAAALSAGEVITLADGRQVLLLGLVLNPASGKTYAAGEAPEALHVTDGVQHHRFILGDLLSVLEIGPLLPGPDESVSATPTAPDAEGEDGASALSTPAGASAETPDAPAANPELAESPEKSGDASPKAEAAALTPPAPEAAEAGVTAPAD